MAGLTFNPFPQTTGVGSFAIQSDGLICGTAYPDPETRFALAGGFLNASETLPMWGGVGIQEFIPQETGNNPSPVLGEGIGRATANANLLGFSVYDQNYAAINFPGSPVPQTPNFGLVNFFRIGSGQRVALQINAALISLEGGLINAAVGWDFTNQLIIAGSGFPGKILAIKNGNCMAASYNAGTGALTWNFNASAAIVLL